MVSTATLEVIRARFALKNGKKKIIKRPPRWLYPINAEKKYRRELLELVRTIKDMVNKFLIPQIPFLLNQAIVEQRTDDYLSDLKRTLGFIREGLSPKIAETKLEADQTGVAISIYNAIQFNKFISSVFEIDIFEAEPWLRDQLALFSSQNSELIESLADQEIERISGIVQRGFQNGSRFTEVAKDIQESTGITRRRAQIIARDQTSKLNSSLSRLRQESLGIDEFEWSTSNDERVRHSHKVLNGKICKYSDPTVYKEKTSNKWLKRSSIGATQTQVGQDVMCRCVALAVIEGIVDEKR